ncbi:hypothetical protein [Gemmata massiliana]|uniref:hypothetical protein n=1 Tax=Gemmata massiliana TaxID=1210884 RepID=UPI0013A69045|nr:hypothetical protein [Gemmata massiliana]
MPGDSTGGTTQGGRLGMIHAIPRPARSNPKSGTLFKSAPIERSDLEPICTQKIRAAEGLNKIGNYLLTEFDKNGAG